MEEVKIDTNFLEGNFFSSYKNLFFSMKIYDMVLSSIQYSFTYSFNNYLLGNFYMFQALFFVFRKKWWTGYDLSCVLYILDGKVSNNEINSLSDSD